MDSYGVIGQPISHSLSPSIHRRFAEQTHQQLSYDALEVAPADLASFVTDTALAGFNVTLPHKQRVFDLLTDVSDRAAAAGAVNTVFRSEDGRLSGDNTDGGGFIKDIDGHFSLAGQRVLLLGAGGAAQGIVTPVMDAGVSNLVIANRTYEKAKRLAEKSGASALHWEELASAEPFDGVIHSTAAGHQQMPNLPICLVREGSWCYDLSYGSAARPFLAWGQARGCQVRDGLGMLVEQAALSFAIWRGVQPKTAPVLAELRAEGGG
ncbi:MAG: shikimate dehydrogenase [Pseudomonadota bacterium]